ncbi:phage antirepressor KilAC domain-containing protein [Clostridium sp.]|uniref:phage antirepressor KilAC domain-containing protein n=1 Tax=Clostridium sp. TaxID=1506 RepID=UPI0032176288
MDNLKIFKDESGIFEVATKLENGEWIFDTETVAKSLGFTEVKNGKEYIRWRTVNGYLKFSQDVAKGDFIPEPAVYKLAFKASNEVAEKFQDWLAIEVLPSIRKHGMYATDELLDNPDLLIAAATKLKEERAARLEAEKKVAILKPKAEFYDDVAGSKDAIEMSEVAKVLAIKGMGRNNLFEFLREEKILQSNNIPYQQYVDREYFRVLEQKYITPKGETKINIKTLVFQKGVEYIRKLIKEEYQ